MQATCWRRDSASPCHFASVAQLGSFLRRHLCQKLLFAFHAHLKVVLVIMTLWSEEQRIRESGARRERGPEHAHVGAHARLRARRATERTSSAMPSFTKPTTPMALFRNPSRNEAAE